MNISNGFVPLRTQMPDDIKLEDLFTKHRSEPRNPNIANVFFRCGYIESWGRGYFKIQELCKQVNAKLPMPENLSGGISVVCKASEQYLKLAEQLKDDILPSKLPSKLPSGLESTYNALVMNPYATNKELGQIVGVSDRSIRTHIKQLKSEGFIIRVGSDKSGYWEILN